MLPEQQVSMTVAEDNVRNDIPGANAVTAAPKKREPPPETPGSIRLRYYVILSFWAFVILVGLPIWWWTTTIYRASLPIDQMMDWAEGRVEYLGLVEEILS